MGGKGRVSDHKQFEFAESKILVMIKEYFLHREEIRQCRI